MEEAPQQIIYNKLAKPMKLLISKVDKGLILHHINLLMINPYDLIGENMAKKRHRSKPKLAIAKLSEQLMVFKICNTI